MPDISKKINFKKKYPKHLMVLNRFKTKNIIPSSIFLVEKIVFHKKGKFLKSSLNHG
jgi:hypothetical protein